MKMKEQTKMISRMKMTALCVGACLMLGGCGKDLAPYYASGTQLTPNEIQIDHSTRSVNLDPDNLNPAQLREIADEYHTNGRGQMKVRVTYQRGAGDDVIDVALARVKKVRAALAAEKIEGAKVVIMPVDQDFGRALVSYQVLAALPPKDCTMMPGRYGAEDFREDDKYALGCETKTQISRQIARPGDLLGNDKMAPGSSQRRGTMTTTTYESGEPMQPLGSGLSASGGEGGSL